ncbi:transketolase [Phormidium sp. CCY1219]|uniref:transketolase n=1 Tax=Phormidium sp. CCY1219 TaxID=2886104 RepID=UPI002D1F04CE|nr:transketolase [Phormidium sp. CCY1219]MEB3829615.1 transketolase [Phormidium sp. CCY1219]
MTNANQLQEWHELAQQLRVDSIRCTSEAGSGHPTSSMSAADLMAVLLTKYLTFDFDNPENPNNDRVIFSKGHASPLLYSMLKAAGVISDEQLMSLRQFGSPVEGHPTPKLPGIDVGTGSLGQGLTIGFGMALAGKYLNEVPARIWVLQGDSETGEGSVWEAFDRASYYHLNNISLIIDVNRLGQRGETELGWNTQAYAERARAFGWHAIEIDGHDLGEVDRAYAEALTIEDRPTAIIARTIKAKGYAELEDENGHHGKNLKPEQTEAAIAELGGERNIRIEVQKPKAAKPAAPAKAQPLELPHFEMGESVATRDAYGQALKALGAAQPEVVGLDGEVSNSTRAKFFAKTYPERYFEMFIGEQLMVGAAVGLQALNYKPFASSFAAFLSRAYDFVRMAAVSRANLKLVGSHAGVSIGQDGPSQMGLEDIAAFRAVWSSTVLYPCDGNQTAKLVEQMSDRPGICYLRTTRMKTPVIYDADEAFPIGGSKVLRSCDRDRLTIIGAGVTLHEALSAYDRLKKEGILARVIDLYSVKPIDVETLYQAAHDTEGNLIVVEDHWSEGGLGAAVLDAFTGTDSAPVYDGPPLRPIKLAVRDMPGSGQPAEMLHGAKIDADAIVAAAQSLVKQPVGSSV